MATTQSSAQPHFYRLRMLGTLRELASLERWGSARAEEFLRAFQNSGFSSLGAWQVENPENRGQDGNRHGLA